MLVSIPLFRTACSEFSLSESFSIGSPDLFGDSDFWSLFDEPDGSHSSIVFKPKYFLRILSIDFSIFSICSRFSHVFFVQ